ncbi:MAG: hypothetical protein JO209_04345 [Acidisphaera sp.]|nr:hypothetical protein [Acidisphaera sp.]
MSDPDFPAFDAQQADRNALRAVEDLAESISGTVQIARALVETSRRVDLSGLDREMGLLCAQALDLPPIEGRKLRPRLIGLLTELDALSIVLSSAAPEEPDPPPAPAPAGAPAGAPTRALKTPRPRRVETRPRKRRGGAMKQPHTEQTVQHTDDQQNTGTHKKPGTPEAGGADRFGGTRAGAENVEKPAKPTKRKT